MSTTRKPWHVVNYEKGEEILTIFSEAPEGKSPEEIRRAFEKMKPFGFKFESMQEVAFKPNKEGGGNHGRSGAKKKNLLR